MALAQLPGPFTVDEYHRLVGRGILREDDRVELIDGKIVELSPIGPRHAACVDRLAHHLWRLAGDQAVVRVRNPATLDDRSEPQPDLCLLRPPLSRYDWRHPGPEDTLLVIEVAETTVALDRGRKRSLYTTTGIPEFWLVNLPAGCVEVYRTPAAARYAQEHIVACDATLTPLAFPDVSLRVDEILG